MPFSFIEIEEKKSRVIFWVFLCVLLFYVFTAVLLLIVAENSAGLFFSNAWARPKLFFFPPFDHILITVIVAGLAAWTHWSFSTSNLIEKLSSAVGAAPVDPKDTYHEYFQRIVEEVSVATGGRSYEAEIISSPALNAFSLEDFNGRAVIGITEGLLSRLNRSQIEAVVAHEAAHIVSGDSRAATVVSSLSELYEESLGGVSTVLRGTRGRGGLPLLLIYLVLQLSNLLSKLLRAFLSRQREYRADAVAVRLTRNPLALAEALKLISSDWHGSGAQGERLESLFIVSPRFRELDEEEGLIADIFSTHPPVRSRIGVLLGMAHLDEASLEEDLKNFKRVPPVAMAEFKAETVDQAATPKACPHCKEALEGVNYEGASILKCPHCQGVLAKERDIRRILVRKDKIFSDETQRQFKILIDSKGKFNLKENDAKSAWVIPCPQCGHGMHRQFFVYSYPVEIDRCPYCSSVWLDKEELELLQYIYEHKEEYLF